MAFLAKAGSFTQRLGLGTQAVTGVGFSPTVVLLWGASGPPNADAADMRMAFGGAVSPTTVFIDDAGEVQFVFQGSYATRDQLEGDIEKHLQSNGKS